MSKNDRAQSQDGGGESDWILLQEEDPMKGVSILVDAQTGNVIEMSTRRCEDRYRWRTMPCLVPKYSKVQRLNLENSRYITDLDVSVTELMDLKRLKLTRCSALQRLPAFIGNLKNLQELDFTDSMSIEGLPESIGGLKRYVSLAC